MIHFIFTEQDKRYLFLKGDDEYDQAALKSLKDYVNLVDPSCYLPTYSGIPFTQDFLFDYLQPSGDTVYYSSIGLWKVFYDYFKKNHIDFDGLTENQSFFKNPIKHTFEEFVKIVDSWNLKYKPRPYQYSYAYKVLQWKLSISELATRAGKTLLAYIVFRYAMEYMGVKRILMIVPSISLVSQGYEDFREYSEFFKTECVWGGGKLVESANMTIGTFQSLITFIDKKSKRYNPKFFDGYDCVFVDECHKAKANQIKTLISQDFMKNVKIAFGMTGTLPKEHTIDYYCIHSLLGAKIQTIKAHTLMEEGYVSKIDINQIRINYTPTEERKDLFIKCAEYAICPTLMEPSEKDPKKKVAVKCANPKFLIKNVKDDGMLFIPREQLKTICNHDQSKNFKDEWIKYLKEIISSSTSTNMLNVEKMMAHFSSERIDLLCNEILPQCENNTLILAHHTEYLRYIYNIIKEKFPNRYVDIITGSVGGKERDKIKAVLKERNDCILIASYGCMSTGITLSNLCYGVLFESFKSDIVNMQSLGRGLGLSDMKTSYKVFDIIDVFDKEIGGKKIYLQGVTKYKKYIEEQYPCKITNIKV
jgi:superfamily II DNA or RNA helicase